MPSSGADLHNTEMTWAPLGEHTYWRPCHAQTRTHTHTHTCGFGALSAPIGLRLNLKIYQFSRVCKAPHDRPQRILANARVCFLPFFVHLQRYRLAHMWAIYVYTKAVCKYTHPRCLNIRQQVLWTSPHGLISVVKPNAKAFSFQEVSGEPFPPATPPPPYILSIISSRARRAGIGKKVAVTRHLQFASCLAPFPSPPPHTHFNFHLFR